MTMERLDASAFASNGFLALEALSPWMRRLTV